MGYGEWLHGEAVAAGTLMAADLSRRMGWLDDADLARIRRIHERAGLPVVGRGSVLIAIWSSCLTTRRCRTGTLRLVLPEGFGSSGDQFRGDAGPDAGQH